MGEKETGKNRMLLCIEREGESLQRRCRQETKGYGVTLVKEKLPYWSSPLLQKGDSQDGHQLEE